ncbi:unnamed protein product [Brassica rapa]|uniref:Uncharacterized protein n=1 Tax=Brassica campestris TaxID=3711 RepID=A0A8D9HM72_BRACM|nr:unnamed protein product [Brassica rapa]
MASVTSATVAIPSFTGLKSTSSKPSTVVKIPTVAAASMKLTVKSSLKDFGVAAVAAAASIALAGNAMAIDILITGFLSNSAVGANAGGREGDGGSAGVVKDSDSVPLSSWDQDASVRAYVSIRGMVDKWFGPLLGLPKTEDFNY